MPHTANIVLPAHREPVSYVKQTKSGDSMGVGRSFARVARSLLGCIGLLMLASGCAPTLVAPKNLAPPPTETAEYVVGPGDMLQITVWHNADLSTAVPVRPDGRISTPLVSDLVAAGRTPEQLSREIETRLKKYVSDPIVTVIVTSFVGPYNRQIRIVGEATNPKGVPYQSHMTALDAMIASGGLTPYAAGNRAKIVRPQLDGKSVEIPVRLDDLLKDGDLAANVELQPGDIIIIPQTFF
jgi:polysaccharide biosynthesis/export protein